jgi:hypothetical protein
VDTEDDVIIECTAGRVHNEGQPMETLTITAAEEQLEGLPLVPAMAGSIADMKALRDRCLAAGIPVLVGCPPGAGTG